VLFSRFGQPDGRGKFFQPAEGDAFATETGERGVRGLLRAAFGREIERRYLLPFQLIGEKLDLPFTLFGNAVS